MVPSKVDNPMFVYPRCMQEIMRHAKTASAIAGWPVAVFEAGGSVALGVKLLGTSNRVGISEKFLNKFSVRVRGVGRRGYA
jgi:hypothetical protein